MSRKFKSQASSSRAAAVGFGGAFASSSSSSLSYVTEPLDLSGITDSHLVVSFKNLSKKDGTTKAKALEEIQSSLGNNGETEDAVVEAWVKVYPRTSIDNARRVRQLAHSVQGQIAVAIGKRIIKHMPEVAGAWLSGLYDNDRSVTKATNESFALVFNTPEKLHNIRKAFQAAILEYCRNVIEQESVQTLSDERSVTPDDAEAKYARVISAAIGVVGDLLTELSAEEVAKEQENYEETLSNEKLWDLISHKDTQVRRSILRLVRICLAKQPAVISMNLKHISKCLVSHGLGSDQTGSSLDYVTTLLSLTRSNPAIWTDQYSSKKSADHRLRSFLKKGSQLGPREYWAAVPQLLEAIPREVYAKTVEDAVDLLAAMHGGIIKKEEPRINLAAAFESYITVVASILTNLTQDDQARVAREMLIPIVRQYLTPSTDTVQWAIPGAQTTSILTRLLSNDTVANLMTSEWANMSDLLIEGIKSSAPEQSKDYQRSQDTTAAFGRRWVIFLSLHIQRFEGSGGDVPEVLTSEAAKVARECIEILKTRNGKPYSAAAILENLMKNSSASIREALSAVLEPFVVNDLPKLLLSPSSKYLVSVLYASSQIPDFAQAWTNSAESVLNADNDNAKVTVIEELLSGSEIPEDFRAAVDSSSLQTFVLDQLQLAMASDSGWSSIGRIVKNSDRLLSTETIDEMLSQMTKGLSVADRTQPSIHAIEQIASNNPALLREFVPTAEGTNLLRSLLLIGESTDDHIAQEASALSASIQALLRQESSDPKTSLAVYDLIRDGLAEATSDSVTVETLVELARKALSDAGNDPIDVISKVLPAEDTWIAALNPYLNIAPAKPFAVPNALGGSVYLVQASQPTQPVLSLPRDVNGFSCAYRIASFVTGLLKDHTLMPSVPVAVRSHILQQLALTVELANDNLSLAGSNALWLSTAPEIESDAQDFVFDAQYLINYWLQESADWWTNEEVDSEYGFVKFATDYLRQRVTDASAASYYNARAFSTLTSELVELHGWPSKKTADIELAFRDARKAKNDLYVASLLTGYRVPLSSSKVAERACNEVVADLTGTDAATGNDEALRNLAILNLHLRYQEDIIEGIAKQRVVFFVKKLVTWLQEGSILGGIKAEACRALAALLPAMKDMYGEHWAQILTFITQLWSTAQPLDSAAAEKENSIPLAHASLKLYGSLASLIKEDEPNDDLVDAWKDAQEAAAKGLIHLLKQSQSFPDEFHQPLRIVNELLSRHTSNTSLKHIEEPSELYPLLYVQSGPVQKTAFDILHKQIPVAQEQISFDAALEKKTARLPDELISLILEAPTASELAGISFDRSIPLALRGYLFSWLLIYDHFSTSSYKVKSDYIDNLKEGEHLNALLTFAFTFLGHAAGKPIDASNLPDPTSYTPDSLDPPEKDCHWLLTHLYYLSLLHLPTLTKTWFVDLKSRQTTLAVESWTSKHITPHITSSTLSSVSNWSSSQTESSETGEIMTVKSSTRTREITASYPIDNQHLSFLITLPPTYPLQPPSVTGLTRIAVPPAKWESWLRSTAGIITFSNGSVVDGLVAFKKNIVGMLKGQTECAICYSVVGSDRGLPGKKCGTCRNAFHGGCLFKWFKTSGGSSCPLCRNAFNYG